MMMLEEAEHPFVRTMRGVGGASVRRSIDKNGTEIDCNLCEIRGIAGAGRSACDSKKHARRTLYLQTQPHGS